MDWSKLVGLKVVGFRGVPKQVGRGRPFSASGPVKDVPLSYMLFDDKKTFLEFREQDYYDYHDCNSSARVIHLQVDERLWQLLFDKVGFDESTVNFGFPFG